MHVVASSGIVAKHSETTLQRRSCHEGPALVSQKDGVHRSCRHGSHTMTRQTINQFRHIVVPFFRHRQAQHEAAIRSPRKRRAKLVTANHVHRAYRQISASKIVSETKQNPRLPHLHSAICNCSKHATRSDR